MRSGGAVRPGRPISGTAAGQVRRGRVVLPALWQPGYGHRSGLPSIRLPDAIPSFSTSGEGTGVRVYDGVEVSGPDPNYEGFAWSIGTHYEFALAFFISRFTSDRQKIGLSIRLRDNCKIKSGVLSDENPPARSIGHAMENAKLPPLGSDVSSGLKPSRDTCQPV